MGRGSSRDAEMRGGGDSGLLQMPIGAEETFYPW